MKQNVEKQKRVRKEATFESLKIRCPKTDKIVSVSADASLIWDGYDSDEWGGQDGHGGVSVTVSCTCGEDHYIHLHSW